MWNINDGSHRLTIHAHDGGIWGAFVCPDGFLWTYGNDAFIKKWNLDSGGQLGQWNILNDRPCRAHYHYAMTYPRLRLPVIKLFS